MTANSPVVAKLEEIRARFMEDADRYSDPENSAAAVSNALAIEAAIANLRTCNEVVLKCADILDSLEANPKDIEDGEKYDCYALGLSKGRTAILKHFGLEQK